MKIAFVNDSCERLGLESISALLKADGHDVRLFMDPQLFDDENISISRLGRIFDSKNKLLSELKSYDPDIVGMSVVTDFYPWASRMAEFIKQYMDVPIIFGGIHPTLVPERVIMNKYIDIVCVGEGEYPMLELADSMEKGEIDYGIRNLWFKKNGDVIQNDIRHLISDLDSLPVPDKNLFYSVNPHLAYCYYITTSRGCVYKCSYCCHSFLKELYKGKGIYLRKRSVEHVIGELRKAKDKYSIKYVRFFDDSLGTDPEWLEEFSKVYGKNIGLPFICYMFPGHVSERSVKYLKDAGCCEIELGVQSFTERIRRNVLNRDLSNRTIENAIDRINKEKISIIADNIFGLPGENEEDFVELANFYNRKRISRIYFFWLRFYPKIKITERAKEQNLLKDSDYEEIINGRGGRPFSRGGHMANRVLCKVQILFFLMPFLPKSIVRFLIRKKIFKKVPFIIPPALLAAATSLFSSSFNDRILRKMKLKHYCYAFKNICYYNAGFWIAQTKLRLLRDGEKTGKCLKE